SFDYGPWRFLPEVDPGFTAAYFDQTGLYAYGRQAEALAWNLSRLGGALTLVASADALDAAFAAYPSLYEQAMADAFFARLGLMRSGSDDDTELVVGLLRWMEKTRVPFDRVLYDWFCGAASESRAAASPLASHYREADFAPVRAALCAARPANPERLSHAYFAQGAPCALLIDEVEALWAPIAASDDWGPLAAKLARIGEMREAYGFAASAFA
ncbi:MAG: protein adenylyltransferase SelO family protein, partial [Parvularculaceae bacterium]|nr:protein adenylyltransferase SelO family protein [Parvularculaceae bacterium]